MQKQIISLRNKQKTYYEISKVTGIDTKTIEKILKESDKAIREKRKNRAKLKNQIKTTENIQDSKLAFIRGDLNLSSYHPLIGKLKFFLGPNYNENSLQDFFKRFGRIPVCPLTGKKINLNSNHLYSLDHIIPVSKGGPRIFDNMQVTLKVVNEMKSDQDLESFIQLCNLIAKKNPRP